MRHPIPLLVLFATTAAVPLAGQIPDPAPADPDSAEVVLLEFAWPVGLTADVESSMRRAQGDTPVQEMSSRYVMEVMAAGDGTLTVRNRDMELTEVRADGEPVEAGADPLAEVVRAFAETDLDYRIARDGEFLGLANMDEARGALARVMDPLMATMDSAAAAGDIPAETVAALRQMMATASSEETLTQGFAEQWGGMVGFWAGAELDLGYTYVMETEEPSPLIPGLVVPMEIEFGAYERTPCHDEAAPDSCVLLEFVSVPDAEVAGPAVEGWLRQIMGPSVDFTLLSMVQENVIQVVVEPGTLIPHAYYTSRVVEMEMEISGAIQGERREDETEVFFRYRR